MGFVNTVLSSACVFFPDTCHEIKCLIHMILVSKCVCTSSSSDREYHTIV